MLARVSTQISEPRPISRADSDIKLSDYKGHWVVVCFYTTTSFV